MGQIMQGFKGYVKDLVHYRNEIIVTIYFRSWQTYFVKGQRVNILLQLFNPVL